MSEKRELRDFLSDMVDSVRDAQEFTEQMTFAEFLEDRKTVVLILKLSGTPLIMMHRR